MNPRTKRILLASAGGALTVLTVGVTLLVRSCERSSRSDLILTLAPGVTLEFVQVPAGEFVMGSADDDPEAHRSERPQHTVHLDRYYIGKYEVTVAQFRAFVEATGYETSSEREGWSWCRRGAGFTRVPGANWRYPLGPDQEPAADDHPVTQVSWQDAIAFAAWASEVTGREVRLPTEAEWEKAARGSDGRLFPWGDDPPDATHANFDNQAGGTAPVGSHPAGASAYGALDMSGNVWEWTASLEEPYPYEAGAGREDPSAHGDRVFRGGGFANGAERLRSAGRVSYDPSDRRYNDIGFRLAVSPE